MWDLPLGLKGVLLGLDSPGGLAFFGCGFGHCLWVSDYVCR